MTVTADAAQLLSAALDQTPCLVIDIGVARTQYDRIASAFAGAGIHYAVKANPELPLLKALVEAGCRFDVASRAEIDLCLAAGASPDDLSYGHPIKKSEDIAYAYARGVRMFAFDSEGELDKIVQHAPGSSVLCRVLASSDGARWPLSRKFGCVPEMAVELMKVAALRGLDPAGIAFHVGSQQLHPDRWEPSVATAAWIFKVLDQSGIPLRILNAGGGFPVPYRSEVAPISAFASAIYAAIGRHFGRRTPSLMIEPGRYIAAPAGVLHTQVVLVARKSYDEEPRWVYLDVGRFGGLAETEDEAIQYELATTRGGPAGPVILAGPTCDSVDILYQHAPYDLPLDLAAGEVIRILGTGAYTATYSAVGFNGLPPLRTVVKS
ncbi:type III PLP-dependent enzyme [Actinoplanes sp. LDG1-06]|uniref:ornithine decarboxylase n=1 Tax=Paractinoplanes ovalisporus TaxID=2810368 RepID=A0ABS2AG50_9ACTN|nr:type III PLP-dependent enzyme [Actinoplanes ovalisporus]MBM2618804.1 type III PLP-dependent enzyme [Actinoplanes ovalisporus]